MDLATIKKVFPRSHIWDEETQDVVDGLRAFIYRQPQPTITEMQNASIKARPVPKGFHCVRDQYAVPDDPTVGSIFLDGVQALGDFKGDPASLASVQVEWISAQQVATAEAASAQYSQDAFSRLSEDVGSDWTIFHVHGGNLFQGSTASYRHITSRLARLSGGRVVSVEYRRCPQHQLPAPLLDVFVAYLSLLYPPPGALHEAVDPSTIIFAGDSSGGFLLILLLLLIQKTKSCDPFKFHSRTVTLPLAVPAGLSIFSPVGESLQSVPSQRRNRAHDIFIEPLWKLPSYPSCEAWPTDPPSPVIYCPRIDQLRHPLLVPVILDDWHGFPPMWFGVGQEIFYDGAKAIARKAARQGVSVTWLEFEAMPHCFFMQPTLSRSKQANLIYERWADFVRTMSDERHQHGEKGNVVKAFKISFKELKEEEVSLEQPEDPPLEAFPQMIMDRVSYLTSRFKREWGEHRSTKL